MPITEQNHSEQARKAFRGITPENIVRHELIGLGARIARSNDPKLIGLVGVIIDETKKMLKIRTSAGVKSVEKSVCTFILTFPSGMKVEVEGKLLAARPEERIKKKFPKKWG